MKLSKKKVFVLALAVCLIATLSMGTLAWFTDQDSVKNDFMIAGSEDKNPDDIFSVDVWEDKDGDGQADDDDTSAAGEGLIYEDILPGDVWTKVAHVKNTGSYDQYIRVKITVSDAAVWQDIYKANMVPVTEFVDVELSEVYQQKVGSYLEEGNFVYYLYYSEPLKTDDPATTNVDESDMIIFNEVKIPSHMTQQQAAPFDGGFQVSVQADAVQTKNVGDNVYDAFKTVGMEIPVNTLWVSVNKDMAAAVNSGVHYIVLNDDMTMWGNTINAASFEIYLNGFKWTTPNQGNPGINLSGELTISGFGAVQVLNKGIRVGSLNNIADITIKDANYIDITQP